MSDQEIPERVRRLIASHIDSVVQVEILLLLRSQPQRWFSGDDVASELRIDRMWARPQLAELCARGMLDCTTDTEPQYRFSPGTHELASDIDELARVYAERRVTVTSLIFAKPLTPLRSFADAFRLRKDRKETDEPNG